MKKFAKIILMVVIILSLGAMLTVAQEEDDDSALFTLVQDEPVVRHSDNRADWDGVFTDAGAVTYHDGKFHMFRNGFRSWPGTVHIGYLTSDDGITWQEESEEPVMTTSDVPFAGVAALASSVLIMDDGTWVLYLYTWEENTFPSRGAIARATAENPLGPWTVDAEPVLSPGADGAWDDLGLVGPRVVKTETGYAMYYGVVNNRQFLFSGIGMATSEDGIVWTKYNDESTTDIPFAESDPILRGLPRQTFVHQPSVHQTEDGWVMFYRYAPVNAPDSDMTIEYATSIDGIEWTPAGQSAWLPKTISGISGFWWTATAYHDDTFYLYVEGGSMGGTNIYVGTYSGKLP